VGIDNRKNEFFKVAFEPHIRNGESFLSLFDHVGR